MTDFSTADVNTQSTVAMITVVPVPLKRGELSPQPLAPLVAREAFCAHPNMAKVDT